MASIVTLKGATIEISDGARDLLVAFKQLVGSSHGGGVIGIYSARNDDLDLSFGLGSYEIAKVRLEDNFEIDGLTVYLCLSDAARALVEEKGLGVANGRLCLLE